MDEVTSQAPTPAPQSAPAPAPVQKHSHLSVILIVALALLALAGWGMYTYGWLIMSVNAETPPQVSIPEQIWVTYDRLLRWQAPQGYQGPPIGYGFTLEMPLYDSPQTRIGLDSSSLVNNIPLQQEFVLRGPTDTSSSSIMLSVNVSKFARDFFSSFSTSTNANGLMYYQYNGGGKGNTVVYFPSIDDADDTLGVIIDRQVSPSDTARIVNSVKKYTRQDSSGD
ncbi:hypothetical protein KW798_02685 [Candidatus Parcubacteria bacterium]|nr:hypothetical protein [Candidatus Parcubacteria bacterium]